MEKVTTSPVMALNITTATFGNEEIRAIDARELHKQLGNKRKFADWIAQRIEQYGFIENEDFHKIVKPHQNQEKDCFTKMGSKRGGSNRIDYTLTLDTAKEIAMVENNEQGRKIRKYLIAVEKEYRKNLINIPAGPWREKDVIAIVKKLTEANKELIKANDELMTYKHQMERAEKIGQHQVATEFGEAILTLPKLWQEKEEEVKHLTEQVKNLEASKQLLAEQHEIIQELTEENMKLNSQEPTERIMQALQELTGQKLLVAPPDAITIKGFLASIKVKLSPGNVLRFSHIARQMCAELGHKIAKIPDERYGFLNLYPQFILKSAFEQMELS